MKPAQQTCIKNNAARNHDEAVVELQRCAGTQFDPQVVHAFLRVLQRTPDTITGRME